VVRSEFEGSRDPQRPFDKLRVIGNRYVRSEPVEALMLSLDDALASSFKARYDSKIDITTWMIHNNDMRGDR